MTEEVWAPTYCASNRYEVSNLGRVRSLSGVKANGQFRSGMVLTPYMTGKCGSQYPTVSIDNKNVKVHRLVAMAFLPPVAGKNQINHKDGVKTNNAASNLEWCTTSENVKHSYDVLRRGVCRIHTWRGGGHKGKLGANHHCSKPVVAVLPDGQAIQFAGLAEASRALGVKPESISRASRGIYKHTGGIQFRQGTLLDLTSQGMVKA